MSSTELLTVGSDAWTMTTPLPAVMYGMRSANVDNKVFFTGRALFSWTKYYSDEIIHGTSETSVFDRHSSHKFFGNFTDARSPSIS